MSEGNGIEELLELTETSLQVSAQVSSLLLEMVRDQVGNEIRYGYGGAIYHGASDAAVNENKVVSMSVDLIDYLK